MKLGKGLMVLSLLAAVVALGSAQITQTGTLNGTVSDSEKTPLPGVHVSIKSSALINSNLEMMTTEKGHYRFPALPPGIYTLTFTLTGFNTLIHANTRVNVGITTTVDVMLEPASIQANVTVISTAPTIDIQKTILASNMTREFLQNIPASRDLTTFFNMVPGVTSQSTHGSSERDNTYNLDGVNLTDPITGTYTGNFGMDIIEELSVQTAALSAEYGNVRGSVINVVTKSGGEKIGGTVSLFYRNDSIGGFKLQSENTDGTIFAGQKSGFDYEIESGINIGGPIIRDKLRFFANLSYYQSQEYLAGYPYDKQPVNTPLDYKRYFPYLKITSQLGPNDRFVLSYNYSDYVLHHRDAAVTRTEDATSVQTTPIHTFNAQWTRFFGSDSLMNIKMGFMNYGLNITAKNDLPRIQDSVLNRYCQSAGLNDLYDINRYQIIGDFTHFIDDWIGRHELKMGMEVQYSWDRREWQLNRDKRSGLGPYFFFRNGVPDYVVNYQDFTRKDQVFALGGFVQDSWTPFKNLTLNIGVRYDHQEGIIPKQGEDRTAIEYGGVTYDPSVKKTVKPLIWNSFSPRIGLTFDLFGDGKTVLKTSFGRLYIANIIQWFVTVNPNALMSWRYRLDSNMLPVGAMYSFQATAEATMDPGIKAPYVDEFTLGVERELLKNLKIGARYIRKWDRNLIEGVNVNAMDYEALKNGADIFSVWTNFAPVSVVDPYDGKTVTFWNQIDTALSNKLYYTNPPGAIRDYDGLEISVDKRYSEKWQASLSYVYAHSRGLIGTELNDSSTGSTYYNDPNSHIYAYGDLPTERKHQIKLSGIWQGPWGINISGYYRWLDGTRWTRMVRAYDLGLSLKQGNIGIYAEPRGSHKLPGLSILDLRLEKSFSVMKKANRIAVFFDVFNVFNINTMTEVNNISSRTTYLINNQNVPYGSLTKISDPRIARLGFRFEF